MRVVTLLRAPARRPLDRSAEWPRRSSFVRASAAVSRGTAPRARGHGPHHPVSRRTRRRPGGAGSSWRRKAQHASMRASL